MVDDDGVLLAGPREVEVGEGRAGDEVDTEGGYEEDVGEDEGELGRRGREDGAEGADGGGRTTLAESADDDDGRGVGADVGEEGGIGDHADRGG